MKLFPFLLVPLTVFSIVLNSKQAFAQRPLGIDVASYQGSAQNPPTNVNWTAVKNSGIVFAWAKATEGTGFVDADFTYNITHAAQAGVLIGLYHYARYDTHSGTNGAALEANYFWSITKNYLKGGGQYIQPMLDIEAGTNGYTKTTLSQWVNAWCLTLSNNAALVGIHLKPCIYASSSHAAAWFDSTVTKWYPDIAAWSGTSPQTGAPSTTPWSTWTTWQYADNTTVPGIRGSVDGDVFNGTTAGLISTLVITTIGPSITKQPASIVVAPGSNVTVSVTGTSGNGTIHYQWQFNGTNISSATANTYLVGDAQAEDAGGYSVVLTDNIGTTTSDTAYLSVREVPVNAPGSILAPSGLVNWWTADGNTLDHIGTVNGTPQGGFYYAPGKSGQAFHLDGSTGFITTGAANVAVPWTFCVWVNRQNSPQTSAGLLEDGTYSLKLEQYNGTRNIGLSVLGVGDYVFAPAYSVPVNTWTHLAFVGTSAGTTLYVNGVLKSSLTTSIPLPRNYIGAAYITSSAKYVDFTLASLDDLMIFNRALSATEIQNIYSAGSAGFVRAPAVTSAFALDGGGFQLDFEGLTGRTFTIHSSTNLVNWTSLGTVPNPAGTNMYIDNAATSDQTYYRISQP